MVAYLAGFFGGHGVDRGSSPKTRAPGPSVVQLPSAHRTHREVETPHHPVKTFLNHTYAWGEGRSIAAGEAVQVACKVYDPTMKSTVPDGYWYLIASKPWRDRYYAPANTFLNGDPPKGPYSHNVDRSVPTCPR
jgi:hypothetical protein